ncbi:MAG: dienelactone hydrolase family protein [Candidatus Rokubacteria bacterium]|nr:dienelactone hydrolase family protein [Candidatus Rokubacteria bacterium]
MLRQAALGLLAAVLGAGCAPGLVHFPNATPGTPLTVRGWEEKPDGPGPFPAVVLLHGCHGVSASTRDWARWFRAEGYVALIVDSWAPRGMTEGCSPESPDVPNTERFDDAVGALRHLHAAPYVDRARVGVIGWSNGGVFSVALVNGPSLERARGRGVTLPDPGFRAAVGVSPGGCVSLAPELVVRPTLVLIGDADDWTRPGPCVEMVENMKKKGADVSIVLYPGAYHYFDVEGLTRTVLTDVVNENRPGGCCGATVGYDPAAAADARRRVADFFGYHLKAR